VEAQQKFAASAKFFDAPFKHRESWIALVEKRPPEDMTGAG
jgi:hypothetical protein